MKPIIQNFFTAAIVWLFASLVYNQAYALDDFDLMKYGPEDTIDIKRTEFIVKFIVYKFPERLNKAFEDSNGEKLPEGSSVRGFAVVNPEEDVCFVHIIAPELWDDRESLTIIGHEIMHCALSDHRDVIINETAEVDTTEKEVLGDIEDLYAQDRLLELEWLKEDYAEMGIVVD
jgi:hypothetical protein